MPLYLVFGGEWLDLACGIPRVWAFSPNIWFQTLLSAPGCFHLGPGEGSHLPATAGTLHSPVDTAGCHGIGLKMQFTNCPSSVLGGRSTKMCVLTSNLE
jgi:hypothetical protein